MRFQIDVWIWIGQMVEYLARVTDEDRPDGVRTVVPVPFGVDSIEIRGDRAGFQLRVEYSNQFGKFGYFEVLESAFNSSEPEGYALVLCTNLGEMSPGAFPRSWIEGGRQWWSYDQD